MAQIVLNIPNSQLPLALQTLSKGDFKPVKENKTSKQNARKKAILAFQKAFDKNLEKPYSEEEFEQIWQKIKQND